MKTGNSFFEKIKASPAAFLVSLFSILGGILFFIIQTGKLFSPVEAEIEMLSRAVGFFEWGLVWSDTLVAAPLFLIGGIFLLLKNHIFFRLGRLFVFAGNAINLYATVFLIIGYQAAGDPILGFELFFLLVWAPPSLLCMIWAAISSVRNRP